MSTIESTNSPFISKAQYATSNGSSSSFLTTSDKSPLQKLVDAQKTETTSQPAQGSYFYSEDYLRLKAFEIRARIVTYQNMGMTAQYAQAQQEGQLVVGAYKAYTKASVAAGEDENKAKAAGAAAAKQYMLNAQRQSFARTPTLLTSA